MSKSAIAVIGMMWMFAPSPLRSSATQSDAVTATVTVSGGVQLPGVPFGLEVEIENHGKIPAAVGLAARLIVQLPGGGEIRSERQDALEPRDSGTPNWVELMPGETRAYSIPFGPPLGWPPWFRPEFSSPGVYEIALELEGSDTPFNYVGKVVTPFTHLARRVRPGTEDAEIWKQMQNALPEGHWSDASFITRKEGVALLREIRAHHPESNYFPYALLLEPEARRGPLSDDEFQLDLATAEKFKDSPAAPYLLLRAGRLAKYAAQEAREKGDATSARAHAEQADMLLARIVSSTSSGAIKDYASKIIGRSGETAAPSAIAAHDSVTPFPPASSERQAPTTIERARKVAISAFREHTQDHILDFAVASESEGEQNWQFLIVGKGRFARPGFHWTVSVSRRDGSTTVADGE